MATIAEIRKNYPQYDDMPDAQLADALYRKYYKDMPRAEFNAKIGLAVGDEASEAPGLGKQFIGGVKNTLAGIVEGAAALPDMATRAAGTIMAKGADLVGADEAARAFRNPWTIGGQAEKLVPVPQDGVGQVVRAASRGLGGVAAGLGAGAALSSSAQPTSRAVGGVLSTAPKQQAVGGVTGALAAEGARAAGLPVPVQIASGIVGGVVGPGVADAADDAVRAGARYITGATTREQTARLLQEAAEDVPAILRRIDDAAPQVSGARPTAAEVSRDSGIAGLQRSLGNTGVAGGAKIGDRMTQNVQLRGDAVSRNFGAGNPQALQNHADDVASQMVARERNAIEAMGPAAYADDSGRVAREAVQKSYDQARAATSRAYNSPELTQVNPVNVPKEAFDDIMAQADAFYGDGGGDIPAKLQTILGDLADTPATTRTLTNIDRRLADFAGEMRNAGRNGDAGFANRVRDVLKAQMAENMPPEQLGALEAAKAARSAQGNVFETGAVGRVTDRGDFGRFVMPDAAVPQTLFAKGRAGYEASEQLVSAVGAKQAEQIAREEARRLIQAGPLTVQRLDQFARDYAPAIRNFPGIQTDLSEARKTAALSEAFARSQLGRLTNKNLDPAANVGRLLEANDGGRGLAMLTAQARKNPEALAGLRRAVAQHIETKAQTSAVDAAGNRIPSNRVLFNSLDDVLKISTKAPILAPQQRKVLTSLRDELAGAQFAATANKTMGSDTARNAGVAGRIGNYALRAAAAKSGAMSILDLVRNTFDNAADIHALAVEAMLDPKLAAELLRTPTPQRMEALATRLNATTRGATLGGAAGSGD